MSTEIGLLYFHQGWTDIMNCLPMINIFAAKYRLLYLLVREDAWGLIQFYIRGLRNVVPVYSPHKTLDDIGIKVVDIKHHKITQFEMIGQLDGGRPQSDPMRGANARYCSENIQRDENGRTNITFERTFYEAYGIPYSDRVNKFTLYRDPIAEEVAYNRVVKNTPYICVHNNPLLNLMVCPKTKHHVLELNQASEVFFNYIRILQHAEEIHLIDSVWAGLCYLMDAKYGYFHQKPIYVYCFRDFDRMFTEPVRLPNWNIVTAGDSCKQRDASGMAFVSFASGSYAEPQS